MTQMHEIFELEHCTHDILADVRRLVAQVSAEPVELSLDALQQIVASADTHLFLLRAEGCIAGMCTMAFYRSPTGVKAWIEDVAVDADFRGRGLGRMLVQHAMDFASAQKGCKLMLTSRPARAVANRMYASMGFQRHDTNVYKMQL